MDYTALNRYFSGEACEAEIQEIFQWINAAPENRKAFIKYKKIWVLTARSGKNPDKAWIQFREKLKGTGSRRQFIPGYLRIAASILLILSLGMLMEYFREQHEQVNVLYQAETKIEVPLGQMSKVRLPDGSTVYLNSGTTLLYSGNFNTGKRVVTLEGEAFFDVAKDRAHPFFIQTQALNFKVYGTSFNIQAYPEDREINATLVEGSLGILKKNGIELTRLIPGENANFRQSDRKLVIHKTNLDIYTSWKDGLVVFRNEKLKDIARKIERWYNVEIVIKKAQLGEETYMGTIMKNKPIDQILEVLSLTSSLKYRIVPRADKPTLIYWE